MFKRLLSVLTFLIGALVLAGCGSGSGGRATVTSGAMAPAAASLRTVAINRAANQGLTPAELEVAVDLSKGRAVRIEPAGEGYKVTKLELIGPPPENAAAYAPEPGD